jgi:hypothetical protein
VIIHDTQASPRGGSIRPRGTSYRAPDSLVLAVAHDALVNRPMDQFLSKIAKGGCFVDVESRMAKDERGLLPALALTTLEFLL